ncbi:MAG: DUF1761 domain-containing protein [Parachlamydiales bacterium]
MEVLHLINYWAVIVAAIVFFLLGALWFSPALFGYPWMKCCNIKEEDIKSCGGLSYLWGFLVSFLYVLALAYFIKQTNAHTLGEGACLAFWAWLGFVATTLAGSVIWERKPCGWWAITSGYYLVGLLISSVILILWI